MRCQSLPCTGQVASRCRGATTDHGGGPDSRRFGADDFRAWRTQRHPNRSPVSAKRSLGTALHLRVAESATSPVEALPTRADRSDKSSAASALRFEPDQGWVPVDRRWLGLDRPTIAPTLTVFALAIVMVVVLPFIDATVSYDTAKAGDVIEVQGDVTFVPEAGWAITSGIRAGDPRFSAIARSRPSGRGRDICAPHCAVRRRRQRAARPDHDDVRCPQRRPRRPRDSRATPPSSPTRVSRV